VNTAAAPEVAEPEEVAARMATALGLTVPVPAGSGLEFAVYRAHSREYGDVALRVPRRHLYHYAGREPFTAWRALQQERAICAYLHPLGFPVAKPLLIYRTAQTPVLVSRFLPGDRVGAGAEQVGALLARLHQVAPPAGLVPIDHDGAAIDVALARRVTTRWGLLTQVVPDLPPFPPVERLVALLAPLARHPRLLHLDIRACNLASSGDRLTGLFDWGCAMVGHPALELARVAENALLPENELDLDALLAGYRRHAPLPVVDPRVDAVLRLDGVTMLSVVFSSHAPDPGRKAMYVQRARNLAEVLA
jgi:aminoglycoside phosphotransferase (APT) family kinase protein